MANYLMIIGSHREATVEGLMTHVNMKTDNLTAELFALSLFRYKFALLPGWSEIEDQQRRTFFEGGNIVRGRSRLNQTRRFNQKNLQSSTIK